MSRGQETGTGLPHPSTNFRAGPSDRRPKADGRAVAPAPEMGTGVTAVICGLATLALFAVLGFSLASGAPADGEGEPVSIVARLPAADTAADAGGGPFQAGRHDRPN